MRKYLQVEGIGSNYSVDRILMSTTEPLAKLEKKVKATKMKTLMGLVTVVAVAYLAIKLYVIK